MQFYPASHYVIAPEKMERSITQIYGEMLDRVKYFEENGDECYMADAIAFRSETISKIVAEGHVFIYTKTATVNTVIDI